MVLPSHLTRGVGGMILTLTHEHLVFCKAGALISPYITAFMHAVETNTLAVVVFGV